ncbi:MAG: hypothetical protein RL460_55, partial [Actinomycetota bacterium]
MSPSRNQSKMNNAPSSIGGFEHVVFLGTYNADPFQ